LSLFINIRTQLSLNTDTKLIICGLEVERSTMIIDGSLAGINLNVCEPKLARKSRKAD